MLASEAGQGLPISHSCEHLEVQTGAGNKQERETLHACAAQSNSILPL